MKKYVAFVFKELANARTALGFFCSLVLLSVFYRGIVYYSLCTRPDITDMFRSFGQFVPKSHCWRYLIKDLHNAALLSAPILALGFFLRLLGKRQLFTTGSLGVLKLIIVDLCLFTAGLVTLAHYHLMSELNEGLSLAVITEASRDFGFRDFIGMIGWGDWVCMLAPLAFFHLFHHYFREVRGAWGSICAGAIAIMAIFQIPPAPKDAVDWAIIENPVRFTISRTCADLWHPKVNPYTARKDAPGAAQMQSIKLIDETFAAAWQPEAKRPRMAAAPGKWNVLFFVLESVGADYVFDTSLGNPTPMPFLQKLSTEGLNLANHYSASCSSPSANFSIYTGIYPPPDGSDFTALPLVRIPAFNQFLGAGYNCFLVTPIRTSYFFSRGLLSNNGWIIYDKDSIRTGEKPDIDPMARNEPDSMSFLLKTIDASTTPFCGIYVSYLAHWPYGDNGAEYRICPGEGDKVYRQKYYNNLRALDVQLKRAYDHLAEKHLLEHTVLVIVGDHGEAFGQHSGAYVHSVGTFGEMYRAPAVFYQPRLFPAKTVEWRTSHIDLVPTLLDALGVEFDDAKFQGESIFRGPPRRKYIFFMDRGENIGSIDQSGVKVSFSLVNPVAASAYDLTKDPKETTPVPVSDYPVQLEALIKYHTYQPQLIYQYNASIPSNKH